MQPVQELASPLNIADLVAAGRDTNTTIPIHIYLYMHYDDAWGWNFTTPEQLQTLVDLLDKRYVRVVGFMMHLNGYPDAQKMPLSQQFLQVACPVAASLAPQKVAVHWVNSDEALQLIPKPNKRYGNYRMQPVIPAVCNASNIEYWARMGTAIYGSYVENYADPVEGSGPGTAPVLRWMSKVKSVGQTTLSNGAVRKVAVVDLSPARFPAPSWWSNALVFELANATNATNTTTAAGAAAASDDEEEDEDDEAEDANGADAAEAGALLGAAAPTVSASSGSAGRRLLQAAATTPAAPGALADEEDGDDEEGDAADSTAEDTEGMLAAAAPDPFGRPPLFVYINHQKLQLADWPAGNGTVIVVDVTDADMPVAPGDEVRLLCEDRPIGAFGLEVGADEYNMALCLRGLGGTEATEYDDPNCTPWAKVLQ